MRVTVPARRSATKTAPWAFTTTPRGWRNPRAQTVTGARAVGVLPATLGVCAADGRSAKRPRPTSLAGRGIRASEPIDLFVEQGMLATGAAPMPDVSRATLSQTLAFRSRAGLQCVALPSAMGRYAHRLGTSEMRGLPRTRRHLPGIHPVKELLPTGPRPRPGMLAQHALVDVRPPARRVGQPDVAVANDRLLGDERALPRHVVDVDLHDAHVREHGAEVQRVQVGQVAVVVVRGNVDLARFRQPPDLHRLREAVPGHVDDRDVDCVLLQKRPVLPETHQALTRGQPRRGRLLDL